MEIKVTKAKLHRFRLPRISRKTRWKQTSCCNYAVLFVRECCARALYRIVHDVNGRRQRHCNHRECLTTTRLACTIQSNVVHSSEGGTTDWLNVKSFMILLCIIISIWNFSPESTWCTLLGNEQWMSGNCCEWDRCTSVLMKYKIIMTR